MSAAMLMANLVTSRYSSNVSQLIVVQSFDVVLLHESINVFLDVGDFGREAISDLIDDLFNQKNMLELLAALHDTNDHSLRRVSVKCKDRER